MTFVVSYESLELTLLVLRLELFVTKLCCLVRLYLFDTISGTVYNNCFEV